MSEAVAVAFIAGACSIIGNIIISWSNRKKDDAKRAAERAEYEAKRAAEQQKVNDRLDSMEHKIDIHNGYADKLGSMATSIAVIEAKIENLKAVS